MNVPLNWLKEYIKVSDDIETVAAYFTSIGYMQDRPIQTIAGEQVLDLEVRQNRPDCLSLIGLARELGAVIEKPPIVPKMTDALARPHGDLRITIVDPSLCYRMCAVKIEGIAINDSPEWLKKRLEAYGIKVLNNIVDITNYVMVELGLPMHAFDAKTFAQEAITVRLAKAQEKITLFGGKEITLSPDDLILADSGGPISTTLMGGEAKSISGKTASIILEAAVYNQASVRRSSIRHGIRTESSTRLEKFLNPELVDVALRRAIYLIKEVAGGSVTALFDAYPQPFEKKSISMHISRLHKLTGVDIPHHKALTILNSLKIPTTEQSEEVLISEIPYFRTDIEQEADLIEEVIRIYGYDTIPEKLPQSAPSQNVQSALFDLEERARDTMTALGYDEVITDPLTHEEESVVEPVILENSLTIEKDMLRTSLDASLLSALEMRKKYRQVDIALFEVGKVYGMDGKNYIERRVLGGVTCGKKSYLDVRGDIEVLFNHLGYIFHEDIMQCKVVDPITHVFRVDLEKLYVSGAKCELELLSAPPSRIFHDFSFIVPEGFPVGTILSAIRQVDSLVFSVSLGEMPRKQEDGTKAVFVKVSYSSSDGSLTEADVKPVKERIVNLVQTLVKNEFRD